MKQRRSCFLAVSALALLVSACTQTPVDADTSKLTPPDIEAQAVGKLWTKISASFNDAEQVVDGAVSITGKDLALGYDKAASKSTVVGLRFPDLPIPQGATITTAKLYFVPSENTGGGAYIRIWSEDTDNSSPFNTRVNNLHDRSLTTNKVEWSAPTWSVGMDYNSPEAISPELSGVVQEVVNRSGWKAGNDLAFVVKGSWERIAKSWDTNGSDSESVGLWIKWETADTPPPPEGNKFKANFAMTVKPDFSVAQLEAYDAQQGTEAAKWYKRLIASSEFSKSYQSDFANQGEGYLRTMSRTMNPDVSELLLAFRATGSRDILNRVYELMDVSLSYLQKNNGYLLWEYKNASDWHGSGLEDGLAHGMVAQATYAFYLNRNVDPKYAQMYDRLKKYLRDNWEPSLTGSNGYDGGDTLNDSRLLHSYIGFLRYYWYMHLTLKNSPNSAEAQDADKYFAEARRKSQVISRVLQTAPNNTFVYSHFVWADAESRTQLSKSCRILSSGFSCGYHPLGYPRDGAYSWNALILDGLPGFDKAFAQKLARSYRLNIFNGKPFNGGRTDQVFSLDVGHDVPSNPCTNGCEGENLTFNEIHPIDNKQVSITYTGNGKDPPNGSAFFANEDGMAYLGLWDASGETVDKTLKIYSGLEADEQPKSQAVPALMTAYELYVKGNY